MPVILVVDDDPIVRSMAGETLRARGFEALEAEDGQAALDLIAGTPVDLVILDMLMPRKDGLETVMELRLRRPELRVLAVSTGGRSDPGAYLRAAMTFGAHASMTKPLRPDALIEAVETLLMTPMGSEPVRHVHA